MNSIPKYIDVVFNTPVNGSFTYLTDNSECTTGFRVIAPFGRRSLTGFVISESLDKPSKNFKIKSITRVIDKKSLFGTDEIDLAQWISSRYGIPRGF